MKTNRLLELHRVFKTTDLHYLKILLGAEILTWFTITTVFLITNAMAQEKIPKKIETPHGTVEWKQINEAGTNSIAKLVRELTPDEAKKLDEDSKRALPLIEKYVPVSKRQPDLLENLDLTFAAWLESNDPAKEKSDDIIKIIGAAYGQYCIEHLGVRWAVIKDEFGTDIALVRENPTTRSFPFSSIQYRVEDKKTNFICALYESLKHLIDDAKK